MRPSSAHQLKRGLETADPRFKYASGQSGVSDAGSTGKALQRGSPGIRPSSAHVHKSSPAAGQAQVKGTARITSPMSNTSSSSRDLKKFSQGISHDPFRLVDQYYTSKRNESEAQARNRQLMQKNEQLRRELERLRKQRETRPQVENFAQSTTSNLGAPKQFLVSSDAETLKLVQDTVNAHSMVGVSTSLSTTQGSKLGLTKDSNNIDSIIPIQGNPASSMDFQSGGDNKSSKNTLTNTNNTRDHISNNNHASQTNSTDGLSSSNIQYASRSGKSAAGSGVHAVRAQVVQQVTNTNFVATATKVPSTSISLTSTPEQSESKFGESDMRSQVTAGEENESIKGKSMPRASAPNWSSKNVRPQSASVQRAAPGIYEATTTTARPQSAHYLKRAQASAQTTQAQLRIKPSANASPRSSASQETSSRLTKESAITASRNQTSDEMPARTEKQSEQIRERDRIRAVVSNATFSRGEPTLYVFGKLLGQGSFGVVRVAHHKITGHKVGIKVYEKAKFKDSNQLKRCRVELKLLEVLNHPNIVRLYEGFETTKRIYLVMESCAGGNLCTYVKGKKKLPEREAMGIVTQVAAAVQYLHSCSIVHRDIKLENVLFEGKIVKLCDLGFSTKTSSEKKLRVFCGTPSYMPPEIVRRKEYIGFPVDIWSLGVLFYACLVGRFPFTAKTYPDLYKKIAKGVMTPLPDTVSPFTTELIIRMLSVNAGMRPTAKQVLKSLSAEMKPTVQVPSVNEMTHLISENPKQDIQPALIKQLVDFGFQQEQLEEAILTKQRNHLSATYYLLASKTARKKQQK